MLRLSLLKSFPTEYFLVYVIKKILWATFNTFNRTPELFFATSWLFKRSVPWWYRVPSCLAAAPCNSVTNFPLPSRWLSRLWWPLLIDSFLTGCHTPHGRDTWPSPQPPLRPVPQHISVALFLATFWTLLASWSPVRQNDLYHRFHLSQTKVLSPTCKIATGSL